jgi:hypothetical protein
MSLLSTIMADTGLPALRRAFGADAVYTPPYVAPAEPAPVSTWAIVRTRSDLMGQYGPLLEPRVTAQLPKSDVPRPKIGAALVVGAATYRIDQQLEETDFFVTVAVREASS